MANIVLARAYYERPNFYSAAVYISQSTGSLMFLVNLMLIVAASFGYGLQRLFYGPLRPIETEQLYDKAWFAVSETLLAMTIFRDDIGLWFFTMFLCLLAGKVWQWIGEGRVEFLEQQPPANPRLFHARLASSLLLSVLFDVYMTQYCVSSILSAARPGVMVMFGFEYVLLATASISTLMRYGLSLVEIAITQRQEKARDEARRVAREQARQQAAAEDAEAPAEDEEDEDDAVDVPGWEEKGRWVFYLDLATDFVKASVYMGFFTVLMTFYGIPIHIMRDLFMSVRSLIKRINDFIQYRNATRDMNTRYPDATGDDLSRENICIVCR
jgi:E3 ubiquitin-protein ligase synoviolin